MELKQGNERFEMNLTTLLIVPYGIETHQSKVGRNAKKTFNRTLWN